LYFARGDLDHVSRILATRAARRGFVVSCRNRGHLVAVTGTRGATTVYADVRESGFAAFRSITWSFRQTR